MRYFVLCVAAVLAATLTGCDEGDSKTAQSSNDTVYSVSGVSQKGPFLNGSSVTISGLANNGLESNGNAYASETSDDFGSFAISSQVHERYVEVAINGFYFNEVTGALSDAAITLRALADLNGNTDVNVNLLTHLARGRIRTLVEAGETFADARAQAEGEVLAAFHIDGTGLAAFEEMDLSQTGDSNAVLLAVAAVLSQAAVNYVAANGGSVDAALSALLSAITTDMEDDGTLDDGGLLAELQWAGIATNLATVRANLQGYFDGLGAGDVPAFEGYVDSDGDTVLNKDDTAAPWTDLADLPASRSNLSLVTSGSTLYAIGGFYSSNSTYMDDVSAYDPGTDTWTAKAPMPSQRHSAASGMVNGIIYIIGGTTAGTYAEALVEAYDPLTDSWSTKAPMPTGRTNAAFATVDGIIYVIGGNNGAPLKTVEAYDPLADSWSTKAPLPDARSAARATVLNGRIYVVGNNTLTASEGAPFDSMDVYDPVTNTWNGSTPLAGARHYSALSTVGNTAYVFNVEDRTVLTWQPPASPQLAFPMEAVDTGSIRTAVLADRIFVLGTTAPSRLTVYDPAEDVFAP